MIHIPLSKIEEGRELSDNDRLEIRAFMNFVQGKPLEYDEAKALIIGVLADMDRHAADKLVEELHPWSDDGRNKTQRSP